MDSTSVKALRALEWLCTRGTPSGVTEMSVALSLGKSNAHRILTTLESLGFVSSLKDGRYAPTLKTWEIGCAVLDRLDFKELGRPVMEDLADRTKETVHLSVLDGLDVIYVDKVESNQPVRAYSRIGGRAPAWAVATGKVLLAHQRDIEKALPKRLTGFTSRSIQDRAELLRELEAVRKDGYAINRGEWRDGVCGVGSPIYNDQGEVISSIGISGPEIRLSIQQLTAFAPLVVGSARKISAQLGYRASASPSRKLRSIA